MDNNVQKIRNEIERRMYAYNLKADIGHAGELYNEELEDAKYQVCKELLDFIDSLTKEEKGTDSTINLGNGIYYVPPFKVGDKLVKDGFEVIVLQVLIGKYICDHEGSMIVITFDEQNNWKIVK